MERLEGLQLLGSRPKQGGQDLQVELGEPLLAERHEVPDQGEILGAATGRGRKPGDAPDGQQPDAFRLKGLLGLSPMTQVGIA
jgi:hypothetical protein